MQTPEFIRPSTRKTRPATPASEQLKPKKDQLVDLLRAKGGATVPQLAETLGWLPHTVRAALTGLRKANVAVEKVPAREGEPTRYRINAKRTRAAQ